MEVVNIEFPLKNSNKLTEKDAVKAMMDGLQKLIEVKALSGDLDDILLDYKFNEGQGYAIASISKNNLIDPSKLNTVGASFIFPVQPTSTEDTDDVRQFSVATIQERLKMTSMNPKVRFRLTIMDYKRYWRGNLNKIKKNPEVAKRLRNMFLVDLMGIFSEILPYVQEGKQLASLIGVNQVTEGLTKCSKDLSLAYKKALNQTKTGQLSKSVYTGLQVKYSEFVNLLIPQIFPGIDEIINSNKVESAQDKDTKSFSTTSGGILTIVADDITKLKDLLTEIEINHKNNIPVTVQVIPLDGGQINFDLMPSIGIRDIDAKQFEASHTPDEVKLQKSTVVRKTFKL